MYGLINRFWWPYLLIRWSCCSEIPIGQKREHLLGTSIKELGIWGESFKRKDLIEQLRNGYDLEFETKYIRKTGELGTVLAKVDIMELDAIKYALISGVDITERKKTEEHSCNP